MKTFVMLFLFSLISAGNIYSQYSIKMGMGFDLISQVPYDDKVPTEQFILGNYEISEQISLGTGFRRFVNSNLTMGNFLTEYNTANTNMQGREDGQVYSNEFLMSVARKLNDFSLQLAIGVVRSKVDTRIWIQTVKRSDNSILSEGSFNKTYQWNSYLRSSLTLEYNLHVFNHLEIVPFIQFMMDIRSKDIDYVLESIDEIPDEFKSPVLDEFNTEVRKITHEPKYFVFGIGLKYTVKR